MSRLSLHRLFPACALALAALLSVAPGTASAAASPYSDLVIFGDSLSDTGNTQALFARFAQVPNPAEGPYDGGRFSNGPIWTEYLAAGLGQAGDAKSFLQGGNNYAYAGARTPGTVPTLGDPIPGVLFQATSIWGAGGRLADPNALYVVVGGGNDMRDARSLADGNSALDLAYRQSAANNAVANLQATLGLLASRGAKNVLVSNLPDLGTTPEAVALGVVDVSTDATNRFNALMPGLLGYGASVGLNMSFLDMAGAVAAVRANPAAFGISNINFPCLGFTGSNGAACNVSTFSDALHPSSRGHQIIADAAFLALGVTPVPEPQTVALMLAGLALVAGAARRRSQG